MEMTKRRPRFNPDGTGKCKSCGSIGKTHVGNQTFDDPLGNLCRVCFRQGVA